MSKPPRPLKESRIDDVISQDWSLGDAATTEYADTVSTFLHAQKVFQNLSKLGRSELVTVDVNFDRDMSDPLAGYGKRPTGLLYAIPYLALARADKYPVGVAFHTADPGLWRAADPAMRDLAILLIGVCSSLMGEHINIKSGDVDQAVDWLFRNTVSSSNDARLKAAAMFRQRLQEATNPVLIGTSNVIVDPAALVRLLAKCASLSRLPDGTAVAGHKLLREHGLVVQIDGVWDCLSVEGLFPSVDGGLVSSDFQITGASENSWQYKKEGDRPRVGDYIDSLGQWVKVYDRAKEAVRVMGRGAKSDGTIDRHDKSLANIIRSGKRDGTAQITRVVALACQLVRLHYLCWNEWNDSWGKKAILPWTPNLPLRTNVEPKTMREWLNELLDTIQKLSSCSRAGGEDDSVDEHAIADELEDNKIGWKDVRSSGILDTKDILKAPKLAAFLSATVDGVIQQQNGNNRRSKSKGKIKPIDCLAPEEQEKQKADAARQQTLHLIGSSLLSKYKDWNQRIEKLNNKPDYERRAFLAEAMNVVLHDEAGRTMRDIAIVRRELEEIDELNGAISQFVVLSNWLIGYLDILSWFGYVVVSRDKDGFRWKPTGKVREIPHGAPAIPPILRPDWLNSAGLVASAGYTEYSAGPDRFVEEAGLPKDLLKDIADGKAECPPWLRSLCIMFAKEKEKDGGLGWGDETGWPEFLQSV